MATNSFSGMDPRLVALLTSLSQQQQGGSSEEDSPTPFGMQAGPGLDLLRTLGSGPMATDFTGLPPVVGAPVGRVSGDGDISTPSRMSRPPDPAVTPRIALGAVPNSSLEPAVIQRALLGDTPERNVDDPIETAAPKQGGFPDIQVQPLPSLISAFPQIQVQPMPGLVNGFPDQPIIQGAPQMPQMGFPQAPGVISQAPTAPLAGLSTPQIHQMLAAGQMPGMGSEAGSSSGFGAMTRGMTGSSGGGNGGGSGVGTGTGTGTRTGQVAPAASVASLLPGLIKLLPSALKTGSNLSDIISNLFAPSGGIASWAGTNFDPLGGTFQDLGPLGTGANTVTAPDTLLPTFGSPSAPEDFPNEWEGLADLFSGSPDEGTGSIDFSSLFSGDPEAGLGGGSVDLSPLFGGDPEAGLAGSFGEEAGSAASNFDLGSLVSGLTPSDLLPFLGPALSLGSAAASPNPGQSLLKSGENIALNQGLKYLGNQTGVTDWLGTQLSNLGDFLGLGGETAASALAPEAAGAAFEGGAGAAGGELAGALAGGAGLGSLALPLAALGIIGGLGGMFSGHANSLFGYRPEGWSHAHAMARTGQQNQSMGISNDIIKLADMTKTGQEMPGNVTSVLQQLAIPKSALNMALFRALDEGATENRGTWGQQEQQTIDGLRTLMDHYGDQLDPATRVGLAQAINSRLPQGVQPIPVPSLSPEQESGLNWETQLFYKDQTDPGWRDRMGEAQLAGYV